MDLETHLLKLSKRVRATRKDVELGAIHHHYAIIDIHQYKAELGLILRASFAQGLDLTTYYVC